MSGNRTPRYNIVLEYTQHAGNFGEDKEQRIVAEGVTDDEAQALCTGNMAAFARTTLLNLDDSAQRIKRLLESALADTDEMPPVDA